MGLSILIWLSRLALLILIVTMLAATLDPVGRDIRIAMYQDADKIAHFLATFIMSIVGLIAFPRMRAWWVFGLIAMLAAAVEVAQLFSPRTADISDLLMSWLGIAAIMLAYYSPRIRAGIRNGNTHHE